ncbi:MAG TPA: lysylphosphatidylglycerol synthase transmembrane domain-containing protein [Kofleriaceae bacterium]|nr:lysylphosphatidylglycerol synthase transmembrane domain-containing protein [Kofleriaceae bacterium]
MKIALRVLVIAAIAACLYWFVRELDWAQLATALAHAKLWPIALAAVLNFACLWGKALCWRVMLAPRYDVTIARLFRYTIAAFAGSVLAPARAGEVLRLWTLKRRDGVPVADSAAVAVAEKLLDGISMVLLVAPVPWLLPLPGWVGTTILVTAAVGVAFFIALYIAVGLVHPASESWFARFIAGMHVIRSPRRLAMSLVTLIGVWIADIAMVVLVLYAVGIDEPVAAGVFILFAINLTIALPSTPAGVGAFEVGAIAAMDVLGIDRTPAFAFALIYHALQVVPLVVVGLALEMPLVLGREQLSPEAS